MFISVAGKHYLFLFPSKTHKKFPSQVDKIGWFPSQLKTTAKTTEQKRQNRDKTRFFSASAITLISRRMFVTTLWERERVLFFVFVFFFLSRPQSSEFLQPARFEMLEKVSNSRAKPLSITKYPSQLIETPVFLPASKIPLGNR